MQLEQRVDVLEDKVEDLRVEHAELRTTLSNTATNLDKLTTIVLAEQQIVKMTFTFLGKYYPHILTILGGIASAAYYAGVHHLII